MQTATLYPSAPNFFSWNFYHPEVKTECFSHVFIHDHSLILIDPFEITGALEAEIKNLGSPTAVLLTNGNHKRASQLLKKQLMVPIGASADAVEELHFIPEMIVDSLMQIHGLKPISLKGGGAGEFGYYSEQNKTLVVGDALINPDNSGLSILPEKYCTDAKQLRSSLVKLLELDFDHLLMAHGKPILGSAHAKLSALLK